MNDRYVAIMVAELESFRPLMSQGELVQLDQCLRLLANPHVTNQSLGRLLLTRLSTRFMKTNQLRR